MKEVIQPIVDLLRECTYLLREYTYLLSAGLLTGVLIGKGCKGCVDRNRREDEISGNIAAGNYQTAHELIEKERQKERLSEVEYILNKTLQGKIKQEDAANYVRFHYQEKRTDDLDIFTIRNETATFPFITPLEKVIQDAREYYVITNAYHVYLSNGSTTFTVTESNGTNIEKFLAQNQFHVPALGTSPTIPVQTQPLLVDTNFDGYEERVEWKTNGLVYVFDGKTDTRLQVISVGKPQVNNTLRFDDLNGKRYLAIATDTTVYAIADGWLK